MLRDSAQLAEQANSIPHINSLDFVMESLALGHTVMEHRCVALGWGVVFWAGGVGWGWGGGMYWGCPGPAEDQ